MDIIQQNLEEDPFLEEAQGIFMGVPVYDFLDYRQFLLETYNQLKQKDSKYSFRYLSQKAGFASSSTFKLVIDGKRNISDKASAQICRALRLDEDQKKYFSFLVKFNQAKTPEEKNLYLEKMVGLRKTSKTTELDQHYYDYISNLLAITIREMISIPGFTLKTSWIVEHVVNGYHPKEVVAAIKLLLKLGIVKNDGKGNLIQAKSRLRTKPEVNCTNLYRLYQSLLHTAQESLIKTPSPERDFSALIISLSKNHIPKVKEMIVNFRQALENMINSMPKDGGSSEVYCMNLNLFPMTRIGKKEEKLS